MAQISQTLLNHAEELRLGSPEEVAIGLLKQAGYSDKDARLTVAQHTMEKVAAQELMAMSGIDLDQAVALVKAAKVNLKDLVSFAPEADVDPTVGLLQKAAAYIDELETKLDEATETLEKAANFTQVEEIKLPEQFTKMAGSGAFTFEDLEQLKTMDPALLTKVASVMDEPWEMGRGDGFARPQTDALLEFMLS
jgi:hypothetical protein